MTPHRLHEFNLVTGEWNDSLLGDYLWSNVNFGEAVTQPMTPLAWSVLEFTLADWVFLPGYATTGNIGGIPYLNISIFYSLYHALGRSRADLLQYMEGTLYMRLPDEMDIPLIPMPPARLISAVYQALKIQALQSRGRKRLSNYLSTNPGWFRSIKARLEKVENAPALARVWQVEISPHVKAGVWTVLGTATHSSDYTVKLRRELNALLGPDDANALISNLSHDSALLPSLGLVAGLDQVAKGQLSRHEYLQQYGHRGPHEFEISVPRPVENPAWIDEQLSRLHASPLEVEAMLAKQKESFEAAWARLQTRHPTKANALRRQIAESARRARLREHARSEYVRDRWMVRLFALRAGELTSLGEDVFFLSLAELLSLLSGLEVSLDSIAARQETYRRYKALPPYPSIIRGPFDPFQWATDPERRTDIFDGSGGKPAKPVQSAHPLTIQGFPGSAGRVEGSVRLIQRPEDGDQLQPGEILVTVQTDITWTMLFPRAAAVVTDVGAVLSHAAIVARELGIPAVVGCGDATYRLQSGDRVQVDGGAGVVKILDRRVS
jgi:phosphohistidine swiveling domain-containing protein